VGSSALPQVLCSTAAALAYQAKAAMPMPNQPPASISDVSGVERAEGQQREGHQDHRLQPRVADSLTLNTLSTSVVIAKPARPRGPGSAMPSGNDRTETLDIGHTPRLRPSRVMRGGCRLVIAAARARDG
jgi:hypothetical protein